MNEASPPGAPKEIYEETYMEDALGRLVPTTLVSDKDKLEDQLVKDLIVMAKKVREVLVEFREKAFGDVDAYVALVAEKYDARLGGRKGNVLLDTYDRKSRIQVQIAERIQFGEELQVARSLVDQCLEEWTEGSRDELKVLIQDAFAVDKQGGLQAHRILSLRKLKINHPVWERAMQAINDAMQVANSRRLIRFYETGPNGESLPITLDMSKI